jgi:hypothetical protein
MALEDDVKSWLTSKTIWGAIISAGGAIASAVFKLEIPVDVTTELAANLATIFGAALAVYGRVKAIKKIGK